MKAQTSKVITSRCIFCGKPGDEVEVPIDGYMKWIGGAMVQDAFPNLTADEREALLTGTHAKCWADNVKEEE